MSYLVLAVLPGENGRSVCTFIFWRALVYAYENTHLLQWPEKQVILSDLNQTYGLVHAFIIIISLHCSRLYNMPHSHPREWGMTLKWFESMDASESNVELVSS